MESETADYDYCIDEMPKMVFEILDQTPAPKARCHKKRMLVNDNRNLIAPEFVVAKVLLGKLVDVESYSQKYGFTFTLKSKFHEEEPTLMHKHIIEKMSSSLIWRNLRFFMFGEFTEKGNLHYHGVVYDTYQVDFIRGVNWWRRNYGFAKPEIEIKNYKLWIKYITKNYGKTGITTIWN